MLIMLTVMTFVQGCSDAASRQVGCCSPLCAQSINQYLPGNSNDDCAGEGVDPAVMQQVAKMVGQSCSTCSKAMRAEGIKVIICPITLLFVTPMLFVFS